MAENKGAAQKNQAYAISDVEGTRKLYADWATTYDADTTEGMGYVCLLYTSPSPRDMRRSRMPSSA